MAKKGLGKGLGAIFGEDIIKESENEAVKAAVRRKKAAAAEEGAAETVEENPTGRLMVKVALIEPNKEQPRVDFNEEQMAELAERVAKNRTTVANAMRLLKLDEAIQDLVINNMISSGHARALLGLDDKELQLKAAKMIVDGGLSVRETERLVKRMAREAGEEEKPKKEENSLNLIYQNLEERMKTIMGTKVTIHNKDKNKGRVEIEYYSEAELERIVEMIESIR